MTDLAIVVIGFDRPHSLSRLLHSLNGVAFDGNRVPLIVSVDHSGDDAVVRVAQDFDWRHGHKVVRTFSERLGLKQHVLRCGDLTDEHEHLIVLEDDLYVSPNLYRFAVQAANHYRDDERIAGIGLYSHLWNVGCHRPFLPVDDPYDAYLMQFACSWGQVWTRGKWRAFAAWYRQHGADCQPAPTVPEHVAAWSDRSWLKHHIRYCIETQRFFVYPRVALTTNFSDRGQHSGGEENGYQVPLQESYLKEYRFPVPGASPAVYDAFFESLALGQSLSVPGQNLCVDLYGTKRNRERSRYWLTLEPAPFVALRSFDLAFRPHEANVLRGLSGGRIFLYDTSMPGSVPANAEGLVFEDAIVKYDVRNVSYKSLLRYSLRHLVRRLKAKMSDR